MNDTFRSTHGTDHPREDELLALAVGIDSGWDDVAVADVDHVRSCTPCTLRLQALQAWLQSVETAAVAEADAAFPDSRLAAQRDEIMRKLDAAQNRRVIPFPAAATSSAPALAFHARRWVAAAAAAGLVVGLLTGRLLWDQQPNTARDRGRTAAVVSTVQRQAHVPRIERALSHPADEVFLSEIELALESPRVVELQAIDALTPRVRQ
jgi:hypothetical protein